jgi:hypothetical protein
VKPKVVVACVPVNVVLAVTDTGPTAALLSAEPPPSTGELRMPSLSTDTVPVGETSTGSTDQVVSVPVARSR